MDKDDTSGETLILIDFDLAAYGYRWLTHAFLQTLLKSNDFRGYDAAFVLKQISNQAIKDGLTDEFMNDEDINEWLRIYKKNLNDDTVSHEELLFEVNLMLPSVALSKSFSSKLTKTSYPNSKSYQSDKKTINIFSESIMNSSCGHRGNVADSKYLVCKYEELQRMHGYANPVNCESFPNNRPNQCEECEAMLIDCIRNCDVDDAQCVSSCNRDFAYCESNCE